MHIAPRTIKSVHLNMSYTLWSTHGRAAVESLIATDDTAEVWHGNGSEMTNHSCSLDLQALHASSIKSPKKAAGCRLTWLAGCVRVDHCTQWRQKAGTICPGTWRWRDRVMKGRCGVCVKMVVLLTSQLFAIQRSKEIGLQMKTTSCSNGKFDFSM